MRKNEILAGYPEIVRQRLGKRVSLVDLLTTNSDDAHGIFHRIQIDDTCTMLLGRDSSSLHEARILGQLHDSGYVLARICDIPHTYHNYTGHFLATHFFPHDQDIALGILRHNVDNLMGIREVFINGLPFRFFHSADRLAGFGYTGVARHLYYRRGFKKITTEAFEKAVEQRQRIFNNARQSLKDIWNELENGLFCNLWFDELLPRVKRQNLAEQILHGLRGITFRFYGFMPDTEEEGQVTAIPCGKDEFGYLYANTHQTIGSLLPLTRRTR